MRTSQPWTIPFNNTYYICWRDQNGKIKNRPMTEDEDRKYFTSKEPESLLNELLNHG